MQSAGFILLLAAGVIFLFGDAGPRASDGTLSLVPHHAGLLLP